VLSEVGGNGRIVEKSLVELLGNFDELHCPHLFL